MILGYVLDKSPRVKLDLLGLSSRITVEFIVDTGFEGAIALPNTLLSRLNATYLTDSMYQNATGEFADEQVYSATVYWDGEEREIEVLAVRTGAPLVGVELLEGNLLTVDMIDGGEVAIKSR